MSLPSAPGVYRITDSVSGRFYIGSSVNVRNRWRGHMERLEKGKHGNLRLQRIWNRDPARLACTLLRALPGGSCREVILAAEQEYLTAAGVGTNCDCLNALPVAGSHLGRKRPEITRQRLAAANLGKKHTPEAKAKQRAAKLGKPLSEEHRRKLGNAARGKRINRPKGITRPTLRLLSEQEVRELRAKRAEGWSWLCLSLMFGVARCSAKRAAIGETYGDVR